MNITIEPKYELLETFLNHLDGHISCARTPESIEAAEDMLYEVSSKFETAVEHFMERLKKARQCEYTRNDTHARCENEARFVKVLRSAKVKFEPLSCCGSDDGCLTVDDIYGLFGNDGCIVVPIDKFVPGDERTSIFEANKGNAVPWEPDQDTEQAPGTRRAGDTA